jgi:SAM-dependent methyltransferase
MTRNDQRRAERDAAAERMAEQLRDWYAQPLGRSLLADECRVLDSILPDLFGYYLVQLGTAMDAYLGGASLIRRHVLIDRCRVGALADDERAAGRAGALYAHAGVLPLRSDSVDVVLLPHTLDFGASPHEVLREVERVLVSEGHVVIAGFNPWSLWGLRRLFTWHRQRQAPWHGAFRGTPRIKDWLALLGFDVVATRFCFFRPPLRHAGLMRRLQWMERLGGRWWPYLGGTYIIVAKKRVVTLTPIKPRWRPRRSLIRGGVVKPST